MQVMNTLFKAKLHGPGHATWTSNWPTTSNIADSHMLDLLVCSTSLHKHITNCYTTLAGLDSDHHAIAMTLNLTSTKFKLKPSMSSDDINWRQICEEDEQW
jgi:hypothetical protein